MKVRLLKPFPFLLFFFFLSNYLSATPECPIVTGTFNVADGTTSDPSATGWYLDASHVASTGYFAVKSSRLHAQELGGEGVWYSRVFSTAGYTDFQAAVKITAEGGLTSSEYVKIYYKIDGGAETLLDSRTGNFGTLDFTSGTLNGSNIQLVVRIYNYTTNNRYYIEQYRVFKEKGPCAVSTISVTAAAGNGGVLTCSNPSLTLSATATGSGTTTWSWSGPNGYTSTTQNPTVSTAGTYTVVATNSTGTGSTSVTVTENKTPPTVTATGGTLTCGSSVTLSATSSVSGSTYSWTGPNSFTSTTQNPTVSTAGTYTVTVTNPANGCTASTSVTVSGTATASTFWLEDFTGLANGTTSDNGTTAWTATTTGTGTYSVQNGEFKTSFSGQTEGVWTSQVINISSKTNVTFSVDLRSETASSGDFFETADYVRVYYVLNGGTAVLAYEDLAGIGSSTTGTSSYTFTSSALNGSTLQIIIKTNDSDPTERYYFDNIKVSGINSGTSGVSISQTGNVTCTSTAQLFATPSSTASAYSWTGPNSFTSTTQNPVVSAGGVYVVTATLATGCAVSGTITVPENKTAPDITATGGTLACQSSITLNVSSSATGATYSWTGPNSFTSTSKNPSVSTAGTYTATVTNPANGCTASQSVTVSTAATATAFWLEDFTGLANGTTSDTGATAWTSATSGTGTYSVQNGEFKTSFSGQSEGVWTSQAVNISKKSSVTFSVDLRSETASSGDVFETADYVRVYYKLDGGAETLVYEDLAGIGTSTTGTASVTVSSAALTGSTLQVIIKTNNSDPTERYYFDNVKLTGADKLTETATASSASIITCTNTSATLLGSATSSGVSYSWTGPNNYTSTTQNPVVTTAGIYTLTVYNPSTGCSGTDTALVAANITAPTVTAGNSGTVTCSNPTVSITGTVSASNLTYSWTGPNGYTSPSLTATVTKGGTYTLTATDPTNGCPGSAATVVAENTTAPGEISINNSGIITCLTSSITISGSSSTNGVTYAWTGPNNYTSTSSSITVSHGGLYTLTATIPASGCKTSKSTTVAENTSVPVVTITNTSPLSCANPTVILTATTATVNAGYLWIGPDGFADVAPITTVTEAGTYFLTVTNPANGCTTNNQTDVTGDPNDCSARKATTGTGSSAQTSVSAFTYSAYPNPATANGVIQFTSPLSTTVTVGIYNTLGACEKVLFKGMATANQPYRLSVPVNQLHAGAYYYIINTNGKVYTGKLVVVK